MTKYGTLFLDEIGEMPLDMQVQFLRFLETREIMRVGGNTSLRLDVRLIAVTNRQLREAVRQGTFRTDLYYRLKVVTLTVRPLRERARDIPLLAWSFLKTFADEHQKQITSLDPTLLNSISRHSWPGNVCELRNLIETLVIFCKGDTLRMQDVPMAVRLGEPESSSNTERKVPRFRDLNMKTLERKAIL